MPVALIRPLAGFVAGTIAVLLFHQGMYFVAKLAGVPLSGTAWNYAPNSAAFGLPTLLNQMFWGGLWGVLFAMISDRLPGPTVVKGIIFGSIFPMLLGSWLLVPLIKAQPLFSGAMKDGVMKLLPGLLLNGIAFGIGLALLYPMLAGMMGEQPRPQISLACII